MVLKDRTKYILFRAIGIVAAANPLPFISILTVNLIMTNGAQCNEIACYILTALRMGLLVM